MELSAADRAVFAGRSDRIDRSRLDELHCLGTYERKLPVNLQRMMENAYDWEHLPFVHPTSFGDIALVEQGSWGWRCKASLPGSAGSQFIELLVDAARHYWATCVVEGFGQGVEIHTQATAVPEGGITVRVGFYLPQPPESEAQAQFFLAALQQQYATLYDEDEQLMSGRQAAIERKSSGGHARPEAGTALGASSGFGKECANIVSAGGGEMVLRFHGGRWLAHRATCPHLLGPLSGHEVADGRVTCPWHGYRFSLEDGHEEGERCPALEIFGVAEDDRGRLVLQGPI